MADGAREEWRRHWTVVLAAAVATTMPLVYLYSTGVALRALEREFGWSRAQISSGPMIIALVGVVLAPFVGAAIDRHGARRIGLPGAILFCLCIAALGLTGGTIWSWWALWTMLAIVATAITPAVWSAGVTPLFAASRGLALAVTLTGSGLGTIVVPIVATRLIAAFGWRGMYAGLGLVWAVAVLPLVLLFFRSDGRPAAARAARGGMVSAAARGAMASSRFVRLALAACGIALVGVAIVSNMVPILGSHGIGPERAAGVASLVGVGSIGGRLIGGWLLDRMNGNAIAAGFTAMPVLSFVLLLWLPGSVPAAMAAALLLGLAVGVEFDATAYLTARHFGTAVFGTLFGTLTGLLVLMGGIGPFAMNAIYDRIGSYDGALWAFVPVCLISSLLFLTLGPYPPLADGDAAPGEVGAKPA